MEHEIQNTKLPPTISEIKKQQMNQNKRKDSYSEKKKEEQRIGMRKGYTKKINKKELTSGSIPS